MCKGLVGADLVVRQVEMPLVWKAIPMLKPSSLREAIMDQAQQRHGRLTCRQGITIARPWRDIDRAFTERDARSAALASI